MNKSKTLQEIFDDCKVDCKKRVYFGCRIDTPIGQLVAIADSDALYFLEFLDSPKLSHKIKVFKSLANALIFSGSCFAFNKVKLELEHYFFGQLKYFKTKCSPFGTNFQKNIFQDVLSVEYGKTKSYMQFAEDFGKKSAVRAVANAIGANQIAILIPCHRIICANGDIGGYSGFAWRKKYLIEHENKFEKDLD